MKNITLLSCAAFAALSATSSASFVTYTETGFLSGSLGGTAFTVKAFTLRTTADTDNVQYSLFGNVGVWTNAGVTTIDIDGFSTAIFNGSDTFGVFNYDTSTIFQTNTSVVGFSDISTNSVIFGNFKTTENNYDLATSKTFTGGATSTGHVFSTTLGNLSLEADESLATFTAVVAAVPEPSAALWALGTVGTVGFARRRRTA